MKRWQIITASLLGLVLVSLAACSPLGGDEETTQQSVEVVRGDLTVTVSGSGNIETSSEVRLSFGSGGRLDRIYVAEGDEVSKGQVLAKLDTDELELAKSQAEVALAQAELALTQAKLSQQTAEYDLRNTLKTRDALKLALLQAQINTKTAKHHLDETRDIYTWPDIETAQKEVDQWKAYVDYANDNLNDATTSQEQEQWTRTLAYAQARLAAAEAKLDIKVRSYDTEEVAIARLQLEAAEMAEAQAQKNLDELNDDIAMRELQVAAAKESVAQAQRSIALASKSLEQSRKQLDEATIIAPVSGVVASVSAKEGDIIPSPSLSPKPVIELVDPGVMKLTVEVDEIDIPGVKLGQEAIVTLDALPNAEFAGMVTTIFPVPIEVGGVVLYKVKIELNVPEDSAIKIGMSASADIVLAKRSHVLLVPDRAVHTGSEGRTTVSIMVGKQTEERPVVTGISDGFYTEVISGLSEGEIVIETRVKR